MSCPLEHHNQIPQIKHRLQRGYSSKQERPHCPEPTSITTHIAKLQQNSQGTPHGAQSPPEPTSRPYAQDLITYDNGAENDEHILVSTKTPQEVLDESVALVPWVWHTSLRWRDIANSGARQSPLFTATTVGTVWRSETCGWAKGEEELREAPIFNNI